MPTLASLHAIREDGLVQEIVVSDGGSRDRTVDTARRFGCRVIEGQAGRGMQLARGAAQATGRWLLFLHADTRLSPDWSDAAAAFIGRPHALGKAAVFTFGLDDRSRKAQLLERAVAARTRYLGLPYGDQGLLVSRELYFSVGGFRHIPLMEDVDLIRRIGQDRLEVLRSRAITSAARYKQDGYASRILRNSVCLGLFFAGVPPRMVARLYS